MAGLKDKVVTFGIAGLFVLSLMFFVSVTQTNNEMNETILSNSILNNSFVNLNSNLGGYQGLAENQSASQDADNPKTEGGSLLFLSITGTGKVIKGMIMGVYNALIIIPSQLLVVPQVVVAFFTGIIGILIILGAWRLYKAGE